MSVYGSMKHSKPYFTDEQVEAIVTRFKNCTSFEGREVDEETERRFRKYVVAKKHVLENNMLKHVLENTYDITEVEGRVAFRPNIQAIKMPTNDPKFLADEEAIKQWRDTVADNLARTINRHQVIIGLYNREQRGVLSNYAQ